MHRKHVINTVKKYLNRYFSGGWELPTSFAMHTRKAKNLGPGALYSVYVGLDLVKLRFFNGGSYEVSCKQLESFKIVGDNIILNGSIQFSIKGAKWVLTT